MVRRSTGIYETLVRILTFSEKSPFDKLRVTSSGLCNPKAVKVTLRRAQDDFCSPKKVQSYY